MANEIKSVNVTNESEEARIVFYQHFGWKLKSSQRVVDKAGGLDFTKLVLERDTNMNNYQKICELERQCDKIADEIDEMPDYVGSFHSSISIEDWAEMGQPYVGGATHVLGGLIGAVIGGLIFFLKFGLEADGGAVSAGAIVGFLVPFFILRKILKNHSWRIGLKLPSSGIGKRLKKLYDSMIAVELEYEEKENRIAALRDKAGALLDK